jgi:hypothetical protein
MCGQYRSRLRCGPAVREVTLGIDGAEHIARNDADPTELADLVAVAARPRQLEPFVARPERREIVTPQTVDGIKLAVHARDDQITIRPSSAGGFDASDPVQSGPHRFEISTFLSHLQFAPTFRFPPDLLAFGRKRRCPGAA